MSQSSIPVSIESAIKTFVKLSTQELLITATQLGNQYDKSEEREMLAFALATILDARCPNPENQKVIV